jgi:hypothetical protein
MSKSRVPSKQRFSEPKSDGFSVGSAPVKAESTGFGVPHTLSDLRIGGASGAPNLGSEVIARAAVAPVQADGGRAEGSTHTLAMLGTSGPSGPLPFLQTIQSAFGQHDVRGVQSHSDGRAREASAQMGAQAFAQGNSVAFGGSPDLHTAAHEAAHVVQQRAGVHLAGGVGQVGDVYERHADAVADAVVAGKSAEPLLGATPGSTASGTSVQMIQTWQKEHKENGKKVDGRWVDASGDGKHQMFQDVDPMSDEAQIRLENNLLQGDLSAAAIANIDKETIAAIDPMGPIPRAILMETFASSWNEAKHVLAAGKLPSEVELAQKSGTTDDQKKSLQAMMYKLWEYRQWHQQLILDRTKERVNTETGEKHGFHDAKAAGSAGLTSDIDVNLKGTRTELAVKIFNEEFKKDGWPYEAGVVYDVNVYALDFMHGVGAKVDKHLLVSEEGKMNVMNEKGGSSERKQGGISHRDSADEDAMRQEEWALVKLRLYMNASEWGEYKTSVDPDGKRGAEFLRVEQKYETYRETLHNEMVSTLANPIAMAEDAMKTGAAQIQAEAAHLTSSAPEAEDMAMAASNRIYERKLEGVRELRNSLEDLRGQYEGAIGEESAEDLDKKKLKIDKTLGGLRELLSECSLYANEAYITSGGVNQAVVGMQIGKPVELRGADAMNAVHENYADTLKEIGRHGSTLGEAAYKAGKYMWRMAEAIRSLGWGDIDGVIPLFDLGFLAAKVLKADDLPAEVDKDREAQMQAIFQLGLREDATAEDLAAKVKSIANAATLRHNQEQRVVAGPSDLATATHDERH